jgi:hypothetical protein
MVLVFVSNPPETSTNSVSGAWSRDSKYIYFDSIESVPKLYRIRIADHSVEPVASLQSIRLAPTYGGSLGGLAPDDSPLVARDVGSQEIYALDLELP